MAERAGLNGSDGVMEIDLLELARSGPVHFMGISGSGMSALAELVLRSGGQVTGCDLRPGSSSSALRELGATIVKGHDADHVNEAVAVVTTAAVPADHPELTAARARGIPVLKRAAALGALVNQGVVVAISGTHGKTTTTAMTTAILAEAGLDPTGLVGGQVAGWGGGLRPGSTDLFVVEADEYDRSFLTLAPDLAVVTAIGADHLDIYGSIDSIEAAFHEFLDPVPSTGLIALCVDDPGARGLMEELGDRPVIGYGTGPDAALRAVEIEADGRVSRFTVEEAGRPLIEIELGAPGLHNIRNALGALAVSRHLGAGLDAIARGLRSFGGVARRFEELGVLGGVAVVDDYAHHPTEVEVTVAAARAAYPDRRLVIAFQPHLYTRTRDFAAEFGTALAGADQLWITDIFPAREVPIEGVTSELVISAARSAGARDIQYRSGLPELVESLVGSLKSGDLLVTMGAGSITEVGHLVIERLRGEV